MSTMFKMTLIQAGDGETESIVSLESPELDPYLESAKLDSLEILVLSERCEERRHEVTGDWVKEMPDPWCGLKRELMGLKMGGNSQVTSSQAGSNSASHPPGVHGPGQGHQERGKTGGGRNEACAVSHWSDVGRDAD